MIVNKGKMDTTKFKGIFAKKFKNFCSKLPILISYQMLPNGVVVYEHSEENEEEKSKIIHYTFDYSDTIERNIYNIKKILYPYLPTMIQHIQTEIEATTEETNEKVSQHEITLDDVTHKGYMQKERVVWQIEKVIVNRDELFIRNLSNKELRRYKLKYPVVTFLKRLRKGEFNEEIAWQFFSERAVLKPLDPFDEGEEDNKNEN